MSSDLDSATTMQIETKPRVRGRPCKYVTEEAWREARRAQQRARYRENKAKLKLKKIEKKETEPEPELGMVRCSGCRFECDLITAAEHFGFKMHNGCVTTEPFKTCVKCREKRRLKKYVTPEQRQEYYKARRIKHQAWYKEHKQDFNMNRKIQKKASVKCMQALLLVKEMIDMNKSIDEIKNIIVNALPPPPLKTDLS